MGPTFPVEIVRSTRRKRTVEAQIINGTIRVHVPARMKQSDVDRYTAELVARLQRAEASDRIDLVARATVLARRYKLPVPKSIRFVDNQKSQWGSCTPATGEIRLSSRLTQFPSWVLDYVIVHELAHLVEFHHNAKFLALVDRFPKAERARGFLTGVHYSPDGRNDDDAADDTGADAIDDAVDDGASDAPLPDAPAIAEVDYKPTLF
jgi:predicted metal-dependent hydrolase